MVPLKQRIDRYRKHESQYEKDTGLVLENMAKALVDLVRYYDLHGDSPRIMRAIAAKTLEDVGYGL